MADSEGRKKRWVTSRRDGKRFEASLEWEGGVGARGYRAPLPPPQERVLVFCSPDLVVSARAPFAALDDVNEERLAELLDTQRG